MTLAVRTWLHLETAHSSRLDVIQVSDEEVKAAWLQAKASAFQQTEAVCSKVLPFESVIRRRWWHWNALQAPQLAAWWQYLDAVAADGDESALYGLHERCLVPCASYPGLFLVSKVPLLSCSLCYFGFKFLKCCHACLTV